jgi:hypothetical protein
MKNNKNLISAKKRILTISRPRRACYPRGSLSDSLGPHQRGHQGSLSPTFVSAFHAFKNTVSPAFVFNPYRCISDAPKLNIGHPCFLIEGVPPQPNYPPDAVRLSVSSTRSLKWCYIVAYPVPESTGMTAPIYAALAILYYNIRL